MRRENATCYRRIERGTGRPASFRGFTLVEMLLVVAIIGIATAISIPYFAKSIQGNRLAVASRSVVMVSRYARNMAILNDSRVELVFHVGGRSAEVRRLESGVKPPPSRADSASGALFETEGLEKENTSAPTEKESEETPGVVRGALLLERALDAVKIESVDLGDEHTVDSGICSVRYARNGLCRSYSVTLVDENGKRSKISVDTMGTASVENER